MLDGSTLEGMVDSYLSYGGRRIITIGQAAKRYGLTVNAMRKALARLDVRPVDPPPIDERTPVYYLTDLNAAMKARPGKGANLRSGAGCVRG